MAGEPTTLLQQDISTIPGHRVKLAHTLRKKHHNLYVVECICGWSSALMDSAESANAVYAEHKSKAALELEATKGMER